MRESTEEEAGHGHPKVQTREDTRQTAIAVKEVLRQMDGTTRKIWQARQHGYSWKEISKWIGVTEQV